MIDSDPKGNPFKPTAFVFGNVIGQQIKDPKKIWAKTIKRQGSPIFTSMISATKQAHVC